MRKEKHEYLRWKKNRTHLNFIVITQGIKKIWNFIFAATATITLNYILKWVSQIYINLILLKNDHSNIFF